ncbi:MAG: hypothetical protein MUF84_10475 [Anaerolineae bacterium]|jgi:hypothetical protein|nr:hypothetical protein [Anaerolineae bacterium]
MDSEMRIHGLTTVDAILGDMLVYRSLQPMDPRLPGLQDIAPLLDIQADAIPRKSEPNYARVVTHLLRHARALEAPRIPLKRLVFVGDTRMGDGIAFTNLCLAGGWPGAAFIGSETRKPPAAEVIQEDGRQMMFANRWCMLSDFATHLAEHRFQIDEATAVILDLDKTTLGARGRNDGVIDAARIAAVRGTIEALLGDDFDIETFESAYTLLNQPEFHPFTADNQDYLTYLCLILGSRMVPLSALVGEIRSGTLTRFIDYLQRIEVGKGALPLRLRDLHDDIYRRVTAGDPTPFKAFRYNEYRTTVSRMGHLPSDTPVVTLMTQEILITQEVREIALAWHDRGALIFGLSDKPDEASIPTAELVAKGFAPLHRTPTHAVGTSLAGLARP